VLQPEKVRDGRLATALSGLHLEALVVAAYDRILGAHLLTLAPFGAINVHRSLLPRWRGAAPIQWAIASGDRETGVTLMQMDEGLDTGDILLQRAMPIAG
jgi:methionyl-tRNA formyltransferase